MANFLEAVEKTLKWEGGYSNDPSDPGGETNWGISRRRYPVLDIRNLTRDGAIEIYRRDYWSPLYGSIHDQDIANELFDFGVNVGTEQAVKVLQQSLAHFAVGPIVTDGVFGAKTLEAVNSTIGFIFLREFRARQAYYYADLVIRQPDLSEAAKKKWLLGWLRRVMG